MSAFLGYVALPLCSSSTVLLYAFAQVRKRAVTYSSACLQVCVDTIQLTYIEYPHRCQLPTHSLWGSPEARVCGCIDS